MRLSVSSGCLRVATAPPLRAGLPLPWTPTTGCNAMAVSHEYRCCISVPRSFGNTNAQSMRRSVVSGAQHTVNHAKFAECCCGASIRALGSGLPVLAECCCGASVYTIPGSARSAPLNLHMCSSRLYICCLFILLFIGRAEMINGAGAWNAMALAARDASGDDEGECLLIIIFQKYTTAVVNSLIA
jgi:hypothetical protein